MKNMIYESYVMTHEKVNKMNDKILHFCFQKNKRMNGGGDSKFNIIENEIYNTFIQTYL